jgi:hypothetical protein
MTQPEQYVEEDDVELLGAIADLKLRESLERDQKAKQALERGMGSVARGIIYDTMLKFRSRIMDKERGMPKFISGQILAATKSDPKPLNIKEVSIRGYMKWFIVINSRTDIDAAQKRSEFLKLARSA